MPELPILAFPNAETFSIWLEENHSSHPGIWLRIYKKHAAKETLFYTEAVDVALCYGWIDGQKQKGDAESWLQRFTKRGPRSTWSKVNTEHVQRLIQEGRMKSSGMAAVNAAKANGRWENAYAPASRAEMPEDFLLALDRHPKAKQLYETLNKTNRYAIFYRLQSAKRLETRQKRLQGLIEMLERGEKPY